MGGEGSTGYKKHITVMEPGALAVEAMAVAVKGNDLEALKDSAAKGRPTSGRWFGRM